MTNNYSTLMRVLRTRFHSTGAFLVMGVFLSGCGASQPVPVASEPTVSTSKKTPQEKAALGAKVQPLIDKINNDPKISPEDKRKALDRLQKLASGG